MVKKRRRHRKLLAICIGLVALVVALVLRHQMQRINSEKQLLRAVNLPASILGKSHDYVHWTDPLMYTSGYDIIVAKPDSSNWRVPDGWREDPGSIEEIESAYRINIVREWFEEKGISLQTEYDSWTFYETGREEDTRVNWQFFLGLHGVDGMLIVYHGHDLWGLEY